MKRFPGVNVWLAALLVAGLQSAALGYMVVDRAQLLQNGREIVLDVKPVDPRSLFRGDYVILNFGDLSRLKGDLLRGLPDGTASFYVTIRKEADQWAAIAADAQYPSQLREGDVVLKAYVKSRHASQLSSMSSVRVDYGIESYFVPEGEGKRLEKLIGVGEMRVIVAVGSDGRVGIKGIEAKGQRVYEEQVW